ncbi:hypothetical protein [Haloferula sp.]|uniref:hypothetical protein n=1 Tax=Haloferula sp. TaxID=2497595 RepID=UPI003C71DE12
MSTNNKEKPVDLFEKAAETCFQSMKEAMKIQEQFAEKWLKTVKKAHDSEDWSKELEKVATKVTEQAQKNADEATRLMEEGARDGMALFNKAIEMGSIATPGEAQVKGQQLWQESLELLSKNTKAVVQSNAKMLEAWGEMAKANMAKATSKHS